MQGLAFLVMFIWFLALAGGGQARTGGLIHLVLVAAVAMYVIGGVR